MKNDDLTQTDDLARVKYIGPARLKRLKENGITTVRQLQEISLQELAAIHSIGNYYAARIKEAVAVFSARPPAEASKPAVAEKSNGLRSVKNTRTALDKLARKIRSAKEKLKPLWKKKYLARYIVFKKQSNKLLRRIKKIKKNIGGLTDKELKKITKDANALRRLLKAHGKKPKKKAFENLTQEIKLFSGKLKISNRS